MMETALAILLNLLVFLAFPATGRASLKQLRSTGDFTHRDEMLWGARYGGWIAALGICGPYYGFSLWHHVVGAWSFTAMGTGFLLICVFGLIAMSALYWQMAGTFYSLTTGMRRLKRRSTDHDEVLKELRDQIDQRGARIIRWLLGLGMMLWVAFVATFGLPLDRAMLAIEWQDQLEDELLNGMEALPVRQVIARREWGTFSPGYPGVDDLTPDMFPRRGSLFHPGLSSVSVHLQDDAGPSEAMEAADAAERVFAARSLADNWVITVYYRPGGKIERMWPPSTPSEVQSRQSEP